MNKTKKIIFSILFVLTIAVTGIAFAKDPDIYMQEEVKTEEEANQVKAKQINVVETEYKPNLKECTYIDYKTTIEEKVDTLDKITKETKEEKEKVEKEKEEEGYVLTVEVKEHEGKKSTYNIQTLNGIITKFVLNGKENKDYVGKELKSVLNEFSDEDNDEYRIVYTKQALSSATLYEKTFKTEEEAKNIVNELLNKGYTASYEQNNNEVTTVVLTSKDSLTKEEITKKIQQEVTTKEVKDVEITSTILPNTYKSESYDSLEKAQNKYDELINKNIYESVKIDTIINKENPIKIVDKAAFTWIKQDTNSYTEKVLDDNGVEIGYKEYYLKTEEVEKAKSKKEEGLTEAACKNLLNSYPASDGWTSSCEKVTTTTKSEIVNDVIRFNDTKQSERTWEHLDISINQNITVVDAYGNVIAQNIEGSLSNIGVILNAGTSNQKTISYGNPSSDTGRLEVRQNTSKGYTKVTNEDLVRLSATLTYTYNNEKVTKNIVLEGYLDNKYNVCRDRNKNGGGFDLEFDVIVDVEGNVSIVISTEETYTFTATKPAVTKQQGYYDEYKYQKLYQVVAADEDYTYTVNYVATDYDVTGEGYEENVDITKIYYDKYYVLSGIKTTYLVTTIGTIERDESCKTEADYGKLIVNYITKDGEKLTDQLEYKELGNTPYETIKKSFSGYRFVEVKGSTKGVYIAGETIEVTYVYEKMPTIYTGVNENNTYTTILLVSSIALVILIAFKKKIYER